MTKKILSIKQPKGQHVKIDDLIEHICENCRFWNPPHEGERETGECRRRPPFIHLRPLKLPDGSISEGYMETWPYTKPEWWCGEFRRLPNREA